MCIAVDVCMRVYDGKGLYTYSVFNRLRPFTTSDDLCVPTPGHAILALSTSQRTFVREISKNRQRFDGISNAIGSDFMRT